MVLPFQKKIKNRKSKTKKKPFPLSPLSDMLMVVPETNKMSAVIPKENMAGGEASKGGTCQMEDVSCGGMSAVNDLMRKLRSTEDMLNDQVLIALTQQLTKEYFASATYMAGSIWLHLNNFRALAEMMKEEATDERSHAQGKSKLYVSCA